MTGRAVSFDDYTTMAWDQTGTRFFYNDGDAGGIWRYDTATKEKQWIASGWDVALSPDDRYVAYKRSTDRLMIYDMQTGGEWECYHTHSGLGGVLQEYVFSPDSRYIAVSDGYTGLGGGGIDYLYAVDIETGDKIKLFKNYGGVTPLVWR
jgi:WD40 repeat protein